MSGASLLDGDEARRLAADLADESRSVRLHDFPRPGDQVDAAGLYAWFVDPLGASSLSSGLGITVPPGLIYAGQGGAGMSTATIRSRVAGNHVRGNVTGSTFRLALASVLSSELGLTRSGGRSLDGDGERRLSRWMADHLRITVTPYPDRHRLAIVEAIVLAELDPPLNLQGMATSPGRLALRSLRRRLAPSPGAPAPRVAAGRARIPATTGRGPDMHAFLSGLVGRTIPTLTGRPNRVIAVTPDAVLVGSSRSPAGRLVQLRWIQDAADTLYERGAITIDVATVGYRSAFIGAALSALPGTRAELVPRRVTLVSQQWPPRT